LSSEGSASQEQGVSIIRISIKIVHYFKSFYFSAIHKSIMHEINGPSMILVLVEFQADLALWLVAASLPFV